MKAFHSLLVALVLLPLAAQADLPAGGRKSLHGMVVFGSGPYYLDHIPMLSPPHDFQIIAEVRLTGPGGKALTQSFSQKGFTLKPAGNFSLNDYVDGRLKQFVGSIHEGSFEQGGRIVPGLAKVQVDVVKIELARQLPASSSESSLSIQAGKERFEANLIRPEANIQRLRNLDTGAQLWCVEGPDFIDPCP